MLLLLLLHGRKGFRENKLGVKKITEDGEEGRKAKGEMESGRNGGNKEGRESRLLFNVAQSRTYGMDADMGTGPSLPHSASVCLFP